MDRPSAIRKNSEALACVIAGLIAMVRQTQTVARPVHRAILRILRPAEASLRRLIVVVAAAVQQKARQQSREAARKPLPDFSAFARHDTLPAFPLIDPRKRVGGPARPCRLGTPRISVPGLLDAARRASPDDKIDAATLRRRIRRLQYALANLPRQARRLTRLMARRAAACPGPGRVGPIRPGHPPGYRGRAREPVDKILGDCHWLARTSGFKPP